MTKYPRLKVKFNDGTTLTSTFISGRKLGPSSTILKANNFNSGGVAQVMYSKHYMNEFTFADSDSFRYNAGVCIEKELLREFGLQEKG